MIERHDESEPDHEIVTDGGRELPSHGKQTSEDFEFEAGDRVLVRVRERGDSGNIQGKFEADVEHFIDGAHTTVDQVYLDPPWPTFAKVRLRPYDAEFEVLDDDE